MKGNIDRISENFLVVILENGAILNLRRERYPDLKAGDCINIKGFKIEIDKEETDRLKKDNIKLQNDLFK